MRQRLLQRVRFGVWLLLPAWSAAALDFAPTLDSATWQVQQSKLSCRLRQPVPHYGDAVFEARAGGAQRFFLEPDRNPMDVGFARLIAKAPFWNPELAPVSLGPVPLTNERRPLVLDDALTRQLLETLATGLVPELERPLRNDPEITVRVALLPVRFRQAYGKYRDCMGQLLPVSREQVATTVVAFGRDQAELSATARSKLDLLLLYAKTDGSPALTIDAVSTETPRRLENVRLAQERAAVVNDYLVGRGIDPQRIVSNARGERGGSRQTVITVRLRAKSEG